VTRKRAAGRVVLARGARDDVKEIMRWTANMFGARAARRYRALLNQAVDDIGDDPERLGSKARPEAAVAGIRTYHISLSRRRVSGPGVKDPRHFLVCRLLKSGVIEVVRILHDVRDLERHIPQDEQPGPTPLTPGPSYKILSNKP